MKNLSLLGEDDTKLLPSDFTLQKYKVVEEIASIKGGDC